MSKASVMVATPVHRQPHPRMEASCKVAMMTSALATCEWRRLPGDGLVSRARQTLLADFLAGRWEWLYWWDDDIETPHVGGPAGNLFDMLLEHGVDFVGGLYSTRGIGGHCAGRAPEGFAPTERLVPFRYLAGGSMLVRRTAVECIAAWCETYSPRSNEGAPGQTCWAAFQPFVRDNEYLSEDFAFCQRWLDRGGNIWADLDVKLWHWGEAPFALADARKGVA